MAQRSKKDSLLASLSSLPTDNASAEAAWRQALLLRELSRDERVTARKRRAEAEAAKEYAENEAITATKQLCAELQAQARMKLQEAEDTLTEAERVKSNADSYAARVQVNIDTELANAVKIREDAETHAEEIQNNARVAAEAVQSMTKKMVALSSGDADKSSASYINTMSRYAAIKEEEAQKCKDELLVLWTDFFKPQHLESNPDLHTTFWMAAKLCSACKVEVSEQHAVKAVKVITSVMEQAAEPVVKLKVPLIVEAGIAQSWSEAH